MLLTVLNLEVFVLGYGVAMLAGAKALAPARAEGLVVHHCHHAVLLASHVHRRLDGLVAVDFRALQVEQDRTRIVEASGLVAAAARAGRRFAHQRKQQDDAEEQHGEQQEHIGNGHGHGLAANHARKP